MINPPWWKTSFVFFIILYFERGICHSMSDQKTKRKVSFIKEQMFHMKLFGSLNRHRKTRAVPSQSKGSARVLLFCEPENRSSAAQCYSQTSVGPYPNAREQFRNRRLRVVLSPAGVWRPCAASRPLPGKGGDGLT